MNNDDLRKFKECVEIHVEAEFQGFDLKAVLARLEQSEKERDHWQTKAIKFLDDLEQAAERFQKQQRRLEAAEQVCNEAERLPELWKSYLNFSLKAWRKEAGK